MPEKGAGDTIQKRRKYVEVQGIRSSGEEDQAAKTTGELRIEEVANELEAEIGGDT